jgi:prepilin-type N-terminal cleavage/methylation domain-containing protein
MRRGFTLVELLIVMAMIVLVSAIAAPMIMKPLERREIQQAADTVRTKLLRTRIGAMRSSHVYEFQYRPGSGSYRVAPQDNGSSPQGDNSSTAGGHETVADADCPRPEEGALPDGVRFMPENTPDPEATGSPTENGAQNAGGGDSWCDPIIFYPDGTTTDARFIVASTRGFAVHVRLRGVTGNVTLGAATKTTQ